MNTAPVMTAWGGPSQRYPKISGGDLIWSVAIVWLAGFFLTASVVIAGAGCTGDVTRLPYPPEDSGVQTPIQLGNQPTETDPEPPKCSKRESLVFDGGVLSVPLPCDPNYDEKRYRGDPQP